MNWWQRFKRTDAHTQANIVCTAIIMLATIAYTIIAGWQLATMRNTLAEMKRSGEQSAEQVWSAIGNINWMARSMDLSQKSTKNAVQAIQEQMRLDQRAWVGPRTFVILNPPLEANKPIEIGLEYSNLGKTPALNVSGFAQPGLYVSTTQLNFSKWGQPLEGERGAQFPGFSSHIVREFPAIPDPVFVDFLKEKSFLYIYGNIEYDDIFGFHHWTHFCLRYLVPSHGFVYCETFNDVDKESR